MPPALIIVLVAIAAASPSPTGSPAGSAGRGPGFVILAVLLVGAFLFSTRRLRRGR